MAKAINDFIKSMKNLIAEAALANLIPNLFNRIHLRRGGREEEQFDVLRDGESVGFMPGRAVTGKENPIFWICFRQLL